MEENENFEEFNEDTEVLEDTNEVVEEVEETSENDSVIDKLVNKLDELINGKEVETEEEEEEEQEEEEDADEEAAASAELEEEDLAAAADTEITSDSDFLSYIYQEIRDFREEYTEVQEKEVPTIWDKPISEYTTSEGLLLSIFLVLIFRMFIDFIKENVWKWK